jgi:hypothetical protein
MGIQLAFRRMADLVWPYVKTAAAPRQKLPMIVERDGGFVPGFGTKFRVAVLPVAAVHIWASPAAHAFSQRWENDQWAADRVLDHLGLVNSGFCNPSAKFSR